MVETKADGKPAVSQADFATGSEQVANVLTCSVSEHALAIMTVSIRYVRTVCDSRKKLLRGVDS